jgi:hypothetical protein
MWESSLELGTPRSGLRNPGSTKSKRWEIDTYGSLEDWLKRIQRPVAGDGDREFEDSPTRFQNVEINSGCDLCRSLEDVS